MSGDAYLLVESAWELAPDEWETHGSCTTTGDGSNNRCILRIPEGQLHFSHLRFTWGTDNTTSCQRVAFRPSYYLASRDPAFVPWWKADGSDTDCSSASLLGPTEDTKDCFYGAATELAPSWPSVIGTYFSTTTGTVEGRLEMDSANEQEATVGNLLTANLMDDETTSIGDFYFANSMRSYRVECRDKHEQLRASVDVYIADEDLETGEDPGDPDNDGWFDWLQTI
jgi:hypothetical protein